jgi:hypothetical protein
MQTTGTTYFGKRGNQPMRTGRRVSRPDWLNAIHHPGEQEEPI